MKLFKLISASAAAVLCASSMLSASAADNIMTFRIDADETYVSLGQLEEGDAILKGAVYIDNYSGLSSLRLIFKGDEPLAIENGDFTRNPDKKEAKSDELVHKMFEKHDQAEYMQYSEITGESNVVLWYADGYVEDAVGKQTDPDSSFVNFDVRVPKDAAPGDYKCYISTEIKKNIADQLEEDFFAYAGPKQLVLDTDVALTPMTVSVYLRGDVTCDGKVDVKDAQNALKLYTNEQVAGLVLTEDELKETLGTDHIRAARRAGDIAGDGKVDVSDAQSILRYYTETFAGLAPQWEDYFK